MTNKGVYAVSVGWQTGVVDSFVEAIASTDFYPNGHFEWFCSTEVAERYLAKHGVPAEKRGALIRSVVLEGSLDQQFCDLMQVLDGGGSIPVRVFSDIPAIVDAVNLRDAFNDYQKAIVRSVAKSSVAVTATLWEYDD